MLKKEILDFYKMTSSYTDLGLYNDFARNLPDDIGELCLLQRNQIIHPFDMYDEKMRKDSNSCYGDMTKLPKTALCYENDLFPTAQSMLAELLRRDKSYSLKRKIEDKIHVCCREQAILLTSILKSKGISARVRSGFARYVNSSGKTAGDHWITEYYDMKKEKWTLVDPDMYFYEGVFNEYHINFSLLDIPYNNFIFGSEAYLKLRTGEFKDEEIYYTSNPLTIGIEASIHGLFYDFHSLMNNEIIFLHLPKYIIDKKFKLTEEEYIELDELAKLMLDPDKNFDKLLNIWNSQNKFRIMSGGMND